MRRLILIVLASMFLLQAKIGVWTTFCAITQGNDLILVNNKIYVATDGGLLEFNEQGNNIYDTDNGLFKINTTAVASDFRNIIWAGHSDCSISLFDGNGNSKGHLSDIEEFGSFNLNRIYSSDSYIYIATDKLLTRYTYNVEFGKYEVKDSNLMTGNVSDVIVFNNAIYMAAQDEVYTVAESSSNIGDLGDWSLLSGFDPGTIVNKFLEFEGGILVLTSNGVYAINDSIVTKESIEDGSDVLWGAVYNSEFYYTVNIGDIVFYRTDMSLANITVEVCRTDDTIAEKFLIEGDVIHYISKSGFSSYSTASLMTTDYSFNVPKEKGIKKIKITKDNEKLLYLTSGGFRKFDLLSESFSEEYYTERKIWQAKDFIEDNENNVYVCTWSTGIAKFIKNIDDYDF
ncbi:MAG: hypothetical protein KAH33_05720, partial [Candidatus Delongbacteria bacterium]|nr:hypothetical protein [Candidatus Delongbacteria bacterium]